jgi:hypothetical protein
MSWAKTRNKAGILAVAVCALVAAGVTRQIAFQPTVARGGCDFNSSGYGYQGAGYGNSNGYGYGSGDDGCDPVGTFIPVTPTRLLDGRLSPQVLLGPNGTVDVQVTGVAGVPAGGVSAVVLNLTVANPTAPGYFQLYPTGGTTSTSSLNFAANEIRAAETTIKVGAGGRVTIRNFAGTAFPIVDLQGYYASEISPVTGSSYVPLLQPARFIDTRLTATGPLSRLLPNETRTFPLVGIPGATAVVANFTAVTPTAAGFLTAFQAGTTQPTVSNLNWAPGRNIPNLSTVPLGPGGAISVFNGSPGSTDLLIDIAGYYVSRTSSEVGDRFTPVDPARIGDSRVAEGNIGGLQPFSTPNQVQNLVVTGKAGVPANNVSAVVVSITSADVLSSPETYFTAFPGGTTPPLVSNLNPRQGEFAANLAIVRIGFGGSIGLLNNRPTASMVVDIYGYFTGA